MELKDVKVKSRILCVDRTILSRHPIEYTVLAFSPAKEFVRLKKFQGDGQVVWTGWEETVVLKLLEVLEADGE